MFGNFSKRDKQKITRFVRNGWRRPIKERNQQPRQAIPSGPSYIVKLHAELPAKTGTTTITAGVLTDCVVYTRNRDTNVLEVTETTLPVYNLGSLIPSGEYIECVRINGDLFAVPGVRYERVKMVQTGGSDGTASTQATWTYSIKNWAETVTYATNVDPYDATTEPGGMIFRPAIGSWVAATEGSAMFIGGEPFIVSCNEGESVAPCSAVGGASVAETNALSASFMLGGM